MAERAMTCLEADSSGDGSAKKYGPTLDVNLPASATSLRSMSVTDDQIDRAVLSLAEVDYLDLWATTRLLLAEFGDQLDDDPTAAALAAVERLIASDSLRAGDMVPPASSSRGRMTTKRQ
jgi:hypothetical protein